MITTDTWKNGLANGLQTAWMLLKIIVPVYTIVTVLSYTPVIPWLARIFSPIMALAGLPGETALAFVTGAFVSVYAAIGIIAALHLTPFQITTLALMLNFCHEMLVETAILKKAGVRIWPIVVVRFGSAFLAGGLMHQIGKFIGQGNNCELDIDILGYCLRRDQDQRHDHDDSYAADAGLGDIQRRQGIGQGRQCRPAGHEVLFPS